MVVSVCSSTSAFWHQGRNFGYSRTSVTRRYISAGEYQRRTDFLMCFIQCTDCIECRRPHLTPMSIAENRRARFDYHLEERYEAGMVLQGWEIKAIRAGQVQLTDGYVVIRDRELYLIACRINALRSASTHISPEADRTKKLLMHKEEIKRLIGKVEQKGFTLVPLDLHYKGGRVKAEIALAKGKAQHDKRDSEKKKDWEREKGRMMRHKVSSPGSKG